MTAADVLAGLLARGFRVDLAGDYLRIRPGSLVTSADLTVLREHKAELLEMLSKADLDVSRSAARDVDGPMMCAACGRVRPVMFLMTPGQDGRSWALCSRCWS